MNIQIIRILFFFNEDEFIKGQEQDFKVSLVKMKVFNKLHLEEFDVTVFFS